MAIEGCGDSSCIVATPKGMCTNGGCTCFKDIHPTEKRLRVERAFTELRELCAFSQREALKMAARVGELEKQIASQSDAAAEQGDNP